MEKQEILDKIYTDEWEREILEKLNDEEQEIYQVRKEYIEESGDIFFHPNQKIVISIVKGLHRNAKRYGAEYCPCRPVTGNTIEDTKNICPCIYHIDELKKDGICKCRLFVSSKFLKEKGYI